MKYNLPTNYRNTTPRYRAPLVTKKSRFKFVYVFDAFAFLAFLAVLFLI